MAPPTKISVNKNLPGNSHRVNKRVGQAIRQAAVNACRSENFIKDNPPGLSWLWRQPSFTAGTHGYGEIGHVNVTRLIYAMLTKGQPYVERGIDIFEAQKKDRQLRALQR